MGAFGIASLIGGGLGLMGSLMGGSAAEDAAQANQDTMMRLYNLQYGNQANAKTNLLSELYGGAGLESRLKAAGKKDVEARFGTGAWDYLQKDPAERDKPASDSSSSSTTGGARKALRQWFNPDTGQNEWRDPDTNRKVDNPADYYAGYGQGNGSAATTPDGSAFDPSELKAYLSQAAGKRGAFGEMEDQAAQAEREGAGILGNYDRDTSTLQSMFGDTLSDYDRQSAGLQDSYRGAFNDAAQRGAGLESMAAQWGQGQDKILAEDAARQLAGANRTSLARLGAAGFGNSTAVGNQLSGNALASGRDLTRAKASLAQAQLDRQMGARAQTNQSLGGLQSNNLSLLASRAGGRTGLQTGNLDTMRQRLTGRTGLETDTLNRNVGLRQQPLNTRLSLLTNPLMNPGTNIQTSSFYSPSGTGSTQSAFGGFLGNIGGRLFSNGLSGNGQGSQGAPNTGLAALLQGYGT